MVPQNISKEQEDGATAVEMKAESTKLDVLGIGDNLFEQIFIHERFGDVSDEICLKEACQISQLQIGAIPTTQENSEEAIIHVFAKDLRQGSSRFVCLYEGLKQPSSGTIMISLHGALTNHIVLRGTYQTAPVTIYGFKLASIAEMSPDQKRADDGIPEDPVACLEDVCASCKRGTRFVSGDFLGEEELGLLRCFSDDTDDRSKRMIADTMEKLVSVANKIYDSAALPKQEDTGMPYNESINIAISWISTFLATFWDGRICEEALVELASNGLDSLALAFQQRQSAEDFISYGGWALFRAILELRGLPGSFYNKVVSLTWILVKQGGPSACNVIAESDSMGSIDILLPTNEDMVPEKSNAGKRGRNSEKKQHVSKRVKMPDGATDNVSKPNELVDMMHKIDTDRTYAKLRAEFWGVQMRSRKTLFKCILDHSKRFKPSPIMELESTIGQAITFHGICKRISDLLEDLRGLITQTSTPEGAYMEVLSELRRLCNNLSFQESDIASLKLDSECQSFLCSENANHAILQELFVLYVQSFRISSKLTDVLWKLTEKFKNEDLQDFSSTCVGTLSSILVCFGCIVVDNAELMHDSVDYCKFCLQNELLESSSNTNRIQYKRFSEDFCANMRAGATLLKLEETEWESINITTLAALEDCPQSFVIHQVGDSLLAKCRQSVKRYLGLMKKDEFDADSLHAAVNSFGVSLEVLLYITALENLTSLSWWIPKTKELHEMMNTALKSDMLPGSSHDIAKVQRILGNLFACSRVSTGGLSELVDLLGSQLPWIDIRDHSETLIDQSEYFDVLDAAFFDCSVSASMSWDQIRLLLDEPERLGQLVALLQTLSLYLQSSVEASMNFQKKGGTDILLRCLVCATEVFSASMADRMWLHRTGASIDVCSIIRNRKTVEQLLESTTKCLFQYIKDMSRVIRVKSAPLLNALLRAHAAVAIDSQTILDVTHQSGSTSSFLLRRSRWNLVKSLRVWISCPQMQPLVIPSAVSGTGASATESGCTVAFAPVSMLSLSLLLGDIFPSEWPRKGHNNHLSVAEKKYRAALTEEIESCILPFEHFLSCCMSSELVLVRASAVRFISKGAGLGGGMGAFLIGVVSSLLNSAIKSSSFLYDIRQTMGLLVPLLYQPALKAATLDSSIPIYLVKLVENILHQSVQGSPNFDMMEAFSVLTMAFECLTVLSDPSISLDVFNVDENSRADILGRDAGSQISCTILDHIAALGDSIPLALNLLTLMSENRAGRENILHGVIALCTKSEEERIEHPTMQQIMAASEWLIEQYQILQSKVPDDEAQLIFKHLEYLLKITCIRFHEDIDAGPLEEPKSAPSRFAAIAKEASTRGSTDEPPDFLCGATFYHVLNDSESLGVFWANWHSRPESKSRITTQARLSKYVGWDIGRELDRFCIADILHPWLTHPVRPLNESMIPQSETRALEFEAFPPHQKDQTAASAEMSQPNKEHQSAAKVPDEGDTEDTQALQQATRVELGALDNILTTQIDELGNQEAEEEGDLDLYADLYPAAEEDKLDQNVSVEVKEEKEQEAVDIQPSKDEQVKIDFAEPSSEEEEEEEEDIIQDRDTSKAETKPSPEAEDRPTEEPGSNILNFSAAELQELLKDRSKVEDLLANNPMLLEKLKERLKK